MNTEPRILIIEDDPPIRRFLRAALEAEHFAVFEADGGQRGLIEAGTRQPDLVVLDLGLPDLDGIEVLTDLRGWSAVPVIVLSAREREEDKVAALDAGADDYLVKPFQIPELAARCRALLRRPGASLGTHLTVGNVILDSAERSVTVGGTPVGATPREVDLLECLLRRAGHVVAKPALEGALYSMDAEVTPNALEACVSRLRKRLTSAAADVQIRTVHGVGYALFAPATAHG